MAKFKYKYKSIKEVKQRLEKKVQKELAVIDLEIAKKKNEITELSKLLKECKLKILNKKTVKGSEVHFYTKYENYLINQIELADEEIDQLNNKRKTKLDELIKKSKETKTFEKIEKKHFNEFVKENERIEQSELDEIAIQEFIKE